MKRKQVGVGLLLGVMLYAMCYLPISAQGGPQLVNGGFEGEYVEWSQRVIVAKGWTPIHWTGEPMIGGGSSGPSSLPEYKPLPIDVDPYRVRNGDKSQCWFWFYTHGDAAIYQVVPNVPAGWWQAEVWAQAWVSDQDNSPHYSPGEMYISIGIDTAGRNPGGGWPWETSVIWSPFMLVHGNYERVTSHPVYVGRDGSITVYLRAWKKWDQKHGDVYWDDARLYAVAGAGPEPTPQPTPEPCQTCEPCPAVTPCPTNEPCVSGTPCPTPSCPDLPSCPPCVSLDWERMDELIERKLKEREPAYYPVLP